MIYFLWVFSFFLFLEIKFHIQNDWINGPKDFSGYADLWKSSAPMELYFFLWLVARESKTLMFLRPSRLLPLQWDERKRSILWITSFLYCYGGFLSNSSLFGFWFWLFQNIWGIVCGLISRGREIPCVRWYDIKFTFVYQLKLSGQSTI